MILREPCLPPGWYPRRREEIEEFLEPFKEANEAVYPAVAAIAPHAGWYYSGPLAALAVSSLAPGAETVVVIGGHLPRGAPVLAAQEDGVKTPFGAMMIDGEFREAFGNRINIAPDNYQDNTVEVLLPMAHYFFPESRLLWLRFPAEISSFEAGKILADTAVNVDRKIVVLSSTDLTHYGRNYGFSPKGMGKSALEWVKKSNDAAFINAVLSGDATFALKRAEDDSSACSAGAVLGALGFAHLKGKKAKLLKYSTSADSSEDAISDDDVPDSFVGYVAISFG
jgi:AmmeMemoRadiSam system protein B